MNIRELKQETQKRQRMALSLKECTKHAIEQVEQLVADGADSLSGMVNFQIARLEYELGRAKGHYEGEAKALTEVLDLIDEMIPGTISLSTVKKGFDALLRDVAPADQDLPEGEDHHFWLGVTQAIAVFEQATGLNLWGYYDPEAGDQLDPDTDMSPS